MLLHDDWYRPRNSHGGDTAAGAASPHNSSRADGHHPGGHAHLQGLLPPTYRPFRHRSFLGRALRAASAEPADQRAPQRARRPATPWSESQPHVAARRVHRRSPSQPEVRPVTPAMPFE